MLVNIRDFLWTVFGVTGCFGFGLYFSVKFKFRHIVDMFSAFKIRSEKNSGEKNGGVHPAVAFFNALGGTVGIGSVVGVSLSLSLGGPGSIFWMWICLIITGAVKYAEVYLSCDNRITYREKSVGGTPYLLYFKGRKKAATAFALICIFCSFGIGSAVQSGTLANGLESCGVHKIITGAIFTVGLSFVVLAKRNTGARVNAILMPAFCAVYFGFLIYFISIYAKNFPSAIRAIFENAFGIDKFCAGFCGHLFTRSLSTGFSRGIFSAESGMGSSSFAHAASLSQNAHGQSLLGVFEVFADAFVNTLTAFALILSGNTDIFKLFSSHFGTFGTASLTLCCAVFAFASSCAWDFYAECCAEFISFESKKNIKFLVPAVKIMTLLFAFFGVFVSFENIWAAADILTFFMLALNLYMLSLYGKEIKYGQKTGHRKSL